MSRVRITVSGIVQGVGFRPMVVRIATGLRLCGWVRNAPGILECEAEGTDRAIAELINALTNRPPPLSRVDDVSVVSVPTAGGRGFVVAESIVTGHGTGAGIPPDVATCADCLRELFDPGDRRYRHPFITCTACGPRYTIITDLPYDRPSTTMAGFEMCVRCAKEYRDPADRRFHAQPIACPDCGPRLNWSGPWTRPGDPIGSAADALGAGAVIAIKGIGGFHLACRADAADSVYRLRRRKDRPAKPFAVMVADLTIAETIAVLGDGHRAALSAPAHPVVLCPSRVEFDGVAPGLDDLGIMLAYSPVHHLLFDALPSGTVLVMTSANRSGEPIAFHDADGAALVGAEADALLTHDRPIQVPCEDSVVAVDGAGEPVPMRRSRGFAPLSIPVGAATQASAGPPVLGVGGDLKNVCCLLRGDGQALMSAHLGDMAAWRSQQLLTDTVGRLCAEHEASTPDLVIACDAHPRYATRSWSHRHAAGRTVLEVQHHHAHAVSLLAEHRRLGEQMICLAWDGTGFGTDGTVWGGETLLVDADPSRFRRIGGLLSFWLPGGESAVLRPGRIALGLLRQAGVTDIDDLPVMRHLTGPEATIVERQLDCGAGLIATSSMGRLFDGVSALLGVCGEVSYEGQAAIELEHLARRGDRGRVSIPVPLADGVIDHRPTIVALAAGVRAGIAPEDLAAGFHAGLVSAGVEAISVAAGQTGITLCGLSGGVFANALLRDPLAADLRCAGLDVLTHHLVPPNDGGLALGQAVIAARAVNRIGDSAPTEHPPVEPVPKGEAACASVSPAK